MTNDELRALDAEIHERVMGHAREHIDLMRLCDDGCLSACAECNGETVPSYSSDMSAAWLVVEKLTEGEYVKVSCNVSHYHGDYCTVVAAHESQRRETDLVKRDVYAQWGETMPEAICRAALKAVART